MNKSLYYFLWLFLFALINQVYAGQTCKVTEQCIDNSPTKTFSGKVFKLSDFPELNGCWKYEQKHDCPGVDTCADYLKKGCTIDLTNLKCLERDSKGSCIYWQKQADCTTKDSESKTMLACGNEVCRPAPDGTGPQICFKGDPATDNDFGSAVAALEMAKQMGDMKNCFNSKTGLKCKVAESGGVSPDCVCYFFNGNFVSYGDDVQFWLSGGVDGVVKAFTNSTHCKDVANQYANMKSDSLNQSVGADNIYHKPTYDKYSDKGQFNLSAVGDVNATGMNVGNPFVYSFASSNKIVSNGKVSADDSTSVVKLQSQSNDAFTTQYLASKESGGGGILDPDDENYQRNKAFWTGGKGSQTSQGNQAQMGGGGLMIAMTATKFLSDVMNFSTAYSHQCEADDIQKMISVGKNHCLFNYDGIYNTHKSFKNWVIYAYGDKETGGKSDAAGRFARCEQRMGYQGAVSTTCSPLALPYERCATDGGQSSDSCYHKFGGTPFGKQDYLDTVFISDSMHGWMIRGNANCCYASTISRIINKAAFEQSIGGRPALNNVDQIVGTYKGYEICNTDDFVKGKCSPTTTFNSAGQVLSDTSKTFQGWCERGLSADEIAKIDFSKVDFSDFVKEVMPATNTSGFDPNDSEFKKKIDRATKKAEDGANKVKSINPIKASTNYFKM